MDLFSSAVLLPCVAWHARITNFVRRTACSSVDLSVVLRRAVTVSCEDPRPVAREAKLGHRHKMQIRVLSQQLVSAASDHTTAKTSLLATYAEP